MVITIVGNKPPTSDLSAAIDSSHRVVRINKCDHLSTRLIGTRTDAVYFSPCPAFTQAGGEAIVDVLAPAERHVVDWHRARVSATHEHYCRLRFPGFTTFALAVALEAERYPTALIRVAAADLGNARLPLLVGAHAISREVAYFAYLAPRLVSL